MLSYTTHVHTDYEFCEEVFFALCEVIDWKGPYTLTLIVIDNINYIKDTY